MPKIIRRKKYRQISMRVKRNYYFSFSRNIDSLLSIFTHTHTHTHRQLPGRTNTQNDKRENVTSSILNTRRTLVRLSDSHTHTLAHSLSPSFAAAVLCTRVTETNACAYSSHLVFIHAKICTALGIKGRE